MISVKYLGFVLRADNRGEGGILALVALLVPRAAPAAGRSQQLALLGLFGAALLYGDSMITPAIRFWPWRPQWRRPASRFVVPITVQSVGVSRSRAAPAVGRFGPVMVWFVTFAAGVRGIA
jgi:KUP system potassium uptake protein